jgi:hypothetical protein
MYNYDQAVGCAKGYNTVIKAVRYVDSHQQIPPWASKSLRRVLKEVYGRAAYKAYRNKRPKLRAVA